MISRNRVTEDRTERNVADGGHGLAMTGQQVVGCGFCASHLGMTSRDTVAHRHRWNVRKQCFFITGGCGDVGGMTWEHTTGGYDQDLGGTSHRGVVMSLT